MVKETRIGEGIQDFREVAESAKVLIRSVSELADELKNGLCGVEVKVAGIVIEIRLRYYP